MNVFQLICLIHISGKNLRLILSFHGWNLTDSPTDSCSSLDSLSLFMDSTSPFVIHNRCSFDAFVFLWIVCARNMFNFRQSSRRSQGSHPWLTFPRISSDSTMRRWRKKPDKLKKKEIYVPDALDWEWLGGARYEEELAPYLVITFNHNGVSLTCDGWNRLFRMIYIINPYI